MSHHYDVFIVHWATHHHGLCVVPDSLCPIHRASPGATSFSPRRPLQGGDEDLTPRKRDRIAEFERNDEFKRIADFFENDGREKKRMHKESPGRKWASEASEPSSSRKVETFEDGGEPSDFEEKIWSHFAHSCSEELREYLAMGWESFPKTFKASEEEDCCRPSHDAYEEYLCLQNLLVESGGLEKIDDKSASNLLKVFADMNRALVSMQEQRKPEVVTKNLTKATNVLYDIRAQLGEDREVSQLPMREMAKEERVASFRRTLSENLPSDLSNLLVQMHDDALPSLKDDAVFIGKWFEGLG